MRQRAKELDTVGERQRVRETERKTQGGREIEREKHCRR